VSRVDRTIAAAIMATIWAGVLLLGLPGRAALIAHVWLVGVLALALGVALDRLRRAVPRRTSAFDTAFVSPPPARARPASLARVEREVALATGTAFDVHFRLRPVLAAVSSGLLRRRGVELEQRPERAQALLGPAVWELVRPDRVAPDDRAAAGLPIADVERAVDDLERLACS
jgi:hypothetical protein